MKKNKITIPTEDYLKLQETIDNLNKQLDNRVVYRRQRLLMEEQIYSNDEALIKIGERMAEKDRHIAEIEAENNRLKYISTKKKKRFFWQ